MGCVDDLLEHLVKMVFDFLIAESQHADAIRFEISESHCVMFDLRRIGVNLAVCLDFELMLDTKSVQDVRPKRMLTPELESRQTPPAQYLP